MKNIKSYNNYINESLKDKIVGKSDDEIKKLLSGLIPNESLLKSTEYGYLQGIKDAIEKGADIYHSDGHVMTIAILKDKLDIIKYYLSIDEKFFTDKIYKYVSLISDYCSYDTVKFLLDNFKYDTYSITKSIEHLKYLSNRSDILKLFIEYKNKNQNKEIDDANNKLVKSYKKNDVKEFSNILSDGFYSEHAIGSLFIKSCSDGKLKMTKKLLDHGIDIELLGEVGMNNGCYYGNLDTVKLLIKYGVEPTKKQAEIAKNHFHENISDYILNHISNINESLKDKLKGKSEEEILKNIDKMNINNKNNLLRESCKKNYLYLVKILIENGANPNYQKGSPLNWSVIIQNYDMVKFLLDNGADVRLNSDLLSLAKREKKEPSPNKKKIISLIRRYIIKDKLKLNIFNESLKDKLKGKSEEDISNNIKNLPIYEQFEKACKYGIVSIVKQIIDDGHNPVELYNLGLSDSSEYGHLEVVKLLLKDGRIDPSMDDNWAIGSAASNGHLEIVKELLKDKRVDPSGDNNYAIKTSSRFGRLEIVKELLKDKRVDPLSSNNYAINVASDKGHTEIVNILKQHIGLYESLKDKIKGKSEEDIINSFDDMNELLINSIKKNFLNGVKHALNNGANVHYNDDYPLRRAVDENHFDIVKYLVDNGADIHVNNDESLIRSSIVGNIIMIKYLIRKGTNIHSNDNKVLRFSSYYGHEDVMVFLLENFEYDLDTINHAILNAKTGDYDNIVILLNQYIDKKELY